MRRRQTAALRPQIPAVTDHLLCSVVTSVALRASCRWSSRSRALQCKETQTRTRRRIVVRVHIPDARRRCTREADRITPSQRRRRRRRRAGPRSGPRCAATARCAAPTPSSRPARPPAPPSRSSWHPQPLHRQPEVATRRRRTVETRVDLAGHGGLARGERRADDVAVDVPLRHRLLALDRARLGRGRVLVLLRRLVRVAVCTKASARERHDVHGQKNMSTCCVSAHKGPGYAP